VRSIRYTLVTDGPSDRLLLAILDWLLGQHLCSPQGEWFDPRPLAHPPRTLAEKIRRGREMFPCDVVFVHRDAEHRQPGERRSEIRRAAETAAAGDACLCVVPVRMTEAWFLFDEAGIRRAAGVPDGLALLGLPPTSRLETVSNPKSILHEALRVASGLSRKRLERFNVMRAQYRLADRQADYSPLRVLPAFQELETDIVRFLANSGEE